VSLAEQRNINKELVLINSSPRFSEDESGFMRRVDDLEKMRSLSNPSNFYYSISTYMVAEPAPMPST
jgi:hypothetical protein